MTDTARPGIGSLLKPLEKSAASVESISADYLTYFDDREQNGKGRGTGEKNAASAAEIEARRKQEAMNVSNAYYDLATDFYEYGWGEGFHFATLRPGESREHSSAKHEYFLALKMQLKKGQRVLV